MRALALILLGLAWPTAVLATPSCPASTPWPPSFRFEYNVKATRSFLSLSGDNSLTLTRNGEGYSLVSETSASVWFNARQSSQGRLTAGGVVPSDYSEHNGSKPQMSTHLDWKEDKVSFSATDTVLPTQPRMQDRLSLLLQVGWMMKGRATSYELPVAGVRGTSVYSFIARGAEAVETPAGRFETVKLERPLSADDDRLEVWVAPALCHLPVRIRFTDRHGTVIANELRLATFD